MTQSAPHSPDILAQICADKWQHIKSQRAKISEAQLLAKAAEASAPRGFAAALQAKATRAQTGLIAEVKKASPSKGLIRADFDPVAIAKAYEEAGAACLSVLTDAPYFQGQDAFLPQVRAAVSLPVLRKDFMLSPYQVAEARALGADCILLIMAALEDAQAAELEAAATEMGMDVLIEVHDEAELARALCLNSALIGVNNRNLKTMAVDLATTERLVSALSEAEKANRTLICESGIATPADIARMATCQVYCFLVGESLMRQENVAAATKALLA